MASDLVTLSTEDIDDIVAAIENYGKGWMADKQQWFAPVEEYLRADLPGVLIRRGAKDVYKQEIVDRFMKRSSTAHESWGSASVLGTLATGVQKSLSQFHTTGVASAVQCGITLQHVGNTHKTIVMPQYSPSGCPCNCVSIWTLKWSTLHRSGASWRQPREGCDTDNSCILFSLRNCRKPRMRPSRLPTGFCWAGFFLG